jgi:ribosomal protein S18 acetylase RimI-like enzyme
MMAKSEPWLTLGRKEKAILVSMRKPGREIYAAEIESTLAGFIVVCMTGAFVGYIQTICVSPEFRNQRVGSALLAFAEERIFEESPNVFLLVSSFNIGAQRLYLRLGYERIGELPAYVVPGHSEILMRKTIGPLESFISKPRNAA